MKTHKILDSKNLILFVGTFDECSNFMESHNIEKQFTYERCTIHELSKKEKFKHNKIKIIGYPINGSLVTPPKLILDINKLKNGRQ